LPPVDDELLPRGLLLLRVEPAEVADPGVSRIVPPAAAKSLRAPLSLRSLKPSPNQARVLVLVLAIALLVGLALLAFRRHRGLG
jgi:hypothetical protein